MWGGEGQAGAVPAARGADVTRGALRGRPAAMEAREPLRDVRGALRAVLARLRGAGRDRGRGQGRAGVGPSRAGSPRAELCLCRCRGRAGRGPRAVRAAALLGRARYGQGAAGPGRDREGPGPGARGAGPGQGCSPRRVSSCGVCSPLVESRNRQGWEREIFKIKSNR